MRGVVCGCSVGVFVSVVVGVVTVAIVTRLCCALFVARDLVPCRCLCGLLVCAGGQCPSLPVVVVVVVRGCEWPVAPVFLVV